MQREIEIYDRDAYRAKTEKIFQEGIFFEEVYKRANAIVCDIINEMQMYLADSKIKGGHKTKYHDMGNNIVVFCAERGQGKTSAMQSYAAYLQKTLGEAEDFFEEKKVHENSCFKVLDPIDPSALDGGESIVRVLLSRLFLEFSNIIEDDLFSVEDEREFRKEKDEILQGFQRCYENVACLQNKKDVDSNDIETLAQLGNSAELKKSLYKLIRYFLKFSFHKESTEKEKYLVVQIDDADLSMGDIFKICDDIRNYFSVPNVIVMMAANYSQLKLAICQRYMKQYEYIVRLQGHGQFEEECDRMAYRYLEKMLPIGHRVMLPEIDAQISENADSIKFLYYKKDAKGEKDLFQTDLESKEESKKCKNMQQQLIKLLYRKTGIILMERKDELHPLFPHTLRELTHFLKMLFEMDDIDQFKAYQVMTGVGDVKIIHNWRKNLELLKEYYLDYWCSTHLPYKQQNLIKGIEMAGRNIESIYQYLNKFIRSLGKNRLMLRKLLIEM